MIVNWVKEDEELLEPYEWSMVMISKSFQHFHVLK